MTVLLESTRNNAVKPQRALVSLVKLGPIPRREARAALIFAMHANQVGILQQQRIPLSVKNAQQDTCKTPQALVYVDRWVNTPFDWEGVLLK